MKVITLLFRVRMYTNNDNKAFTEQRTNYILGLTHCAIKEVVYSELRASAVL
jgi:hypothetical protein